LRSYGLPPGCSLRRAGPDDAERVAACLRADDRLEMEALEGRPAIDVLRGWMEGGSHVLVMRGDLVDMLWLSRLQIDAWQQRWPELQTGCDARNRFRAHWLDWLGFECRGRVERFGAAGLPFDPYIRLGEAEQSPRPWRSP
jgi:hypothetical protein